MLVALRNWFPYLLVLVLVGAAVGAVSSFGTLPQADFTFANGDQIKTIDPARATGQPENRVINGLFEGLLRSVPDEVPGGDEENLKKNVPLKLARGVADLPEVSADGLTYTYKLKGDAKWSNGRTVTAEDFVFSWQRLLHPETASEYAYQLHYVEGCEAYNLAQVKPGDLVEVEIYDRARTDQPFPRGTLVRGKLVSVDEPPKPQMTDKMSQEKKEQLELAWKRETVYTVEAVSREQGNNKQSETKTLYFAGDPKNAAKRFTKGEIERCHNVLPDFTETCSIKALDKYTLQVKLKSATPYFNELVAFYPLYPVCRECVEEHGTPNWTRVENVVSNGAFTLSLFRMRDRIRLAKSDTYWNKDNVHLNTVDVLAVKGDTTALNMYLTGQIDWINTVPNAAIPDARERPDFHSTPMLTVYMYRLNVDKKPLDNVLVRRALNAAIDKKEICERIMKAGQVPANSYVPPGMAGYTSSYCSEFNLDEARRLLAEAGYPNGKGLPKIEIVFNTNDDHATIAQVVQQQWSKLGIQSELRNLEWATFLDTLSNTRFMAARSGWIGDYPDPNTFLDMFVTGGPNNQTNWSNAEYDRLIAESKKASGEERMKLLSQAEQLLMDELPIIPMFFYVSKNMVNPRVKGFTSNIQDVHPLELLRIEK